MRDPTLGSYAQSDILGGRTMEFKPMYLLTLLIAIALMLSACGGGGTAAPAPEEPSAAEPTAPAEEPAEPVANEPVTLDVGTTYIWDTANPTFGWYGYTIRYLIYDTLVEEQGISNFQPGLAESWDVSDDGLVWTFKIREGVKFSDGTPCDANAVAWSLNWTLENDVETFAFYLYNFEEIVALDDTTLQVTLYEPVGNMEYLLMYVWILPESVWGAMTYDEVMEFEDISAATGTGPYILKEWSEGEYMILEANKDYWRTTPVIDQIIYHEYATEDAVVQALLAGEIDVIDADVIPGDQDIRLAMAYAIDQQQIINVAYLGYADAATVVVPKSLGDWHNSDVQPIPFDTAEGNRILDDAGYLDSDGDGVREYSDGTPLEYRLYATDDASNARILEIISDGFSQIGISAPPTLMDEDSLIALYPAFDFDLVYWGWGLDPDPDFAMLIFTCDQRDEGGWSDSGYCDEEFEQMYKDQGVAFDHETRREIIWKMQEKLFNERPYIVLTYAKNIQAYRNDRFTGFGEDTGDILWKAALLKARPVQ